MGNEGLVWWNRGRMFVAYEIAPEYDKHVRPGMLTYSLHIRDKAGHQREVGAAVSLMDAHALSVMVRS